MARASDVSEALATLQARWGAAAPRRGGELGLVVEGALALAPDAARGPGRRRSAGLAAGPGPDPAGAGRRASSGAAGGDADGRVVPTGFAALDAILGMGGLPRSATVALRGDASSGKTTLALRLAAEAQATGAIVAWLDLARAFDPVEAVARGIRPEWLVVLTPVDLEEALGLSAALLAARTVDLLVVDLPDGRDPAVSGVRVGDRLGRLAALARRAGTLLVVVEPNALGRGLAAAVEEASGLRLELERTGWIRLGRDVVGQRSAVTVARNRHGPPGRRADLEILYAEGGARDACLVREELLRRTRLASSSLPAPPGPPPATAPPPVIDPKGPPAIGRYPCACCTCSGRTCHSASHGPASGHRGATASPPRGRPARSSSAVSPGRTGRWSTRTRSHGRSASGGGSRWGAPTGSRPRRPSSTSRLRRTGTPSRPPASGSPRSAPGSPGRATSRTRRSGGSPSTSTG